MSDWDWLHIAAVTLAVVGATFLLFFGSWLHHRLRNRTFWPRQSLEGCMQPLNVLFVLDHMFEHFIPRPTA